LIDLHSHILHGLDDGAADFETSVAMARVAVADGVHTIAATPHIREDHPFDLGEIATRTEELNSELKDQGIPLTVKPAGEVAFSRCAELDDSVLGDLCLGDGRYLLVESPYTHATDLLENGIFDLQRRGFRVLLAHPERSPSFMDRPDRLAHLVQGGVCCSITAASVTGQFGRTVQKAAFAMLREGIVHDLASDAHDPKRRRPELRAAADAVESALPHLRGHGSWFVNDAPAAILAGDVVDEPPQPTRRRSLLRRRF
jgi:protein-tyrosine phosphatase